ncbi:Hypothetical Protein FCC1311_032162 [Hondaea fermentalgiana]|uniref:Uncharacterized protein n=1 Tax=Hondaea fermentalgiana TaxID=2315210 RepID=A0A2R5GEE1_9STRA|nr:Hypothetical Protein FCC1311_032162 [Hondaea fermentalgiana]|eukprot:GBG26993.1 Hypothetical Protein FCC1311_032162 [Hondaea fermentalgiana]
MFKRVNSQAARGSNADGETTTRAARSGSGGGTDGRGDFKGTSGPEDIAPLGISSSSSSSVSVPASSPPSSPLTSSQNAFASSSGKEQHIGGPAEHEEIGLLEKLASPVVHDHSSGEISQLHLHHHAPLNLGDDRSTATRSCRCSPVGLRSCAEVFRAEGFLLRNEDFPLQVEMYLVCSAVTILLIRVGLYATGYPQLGGNGIHIAHMLWGGLLMFASQLLSFGFLGRRVQRLAAILGGIGFGTFIDELGKFITSDNDYFFKPTPFILYIGFCALFVVLKIVEPFFSPERFTTSENLANAMNLMSVHSTAGLSKESRLVLIELLEGCDANHPLVQPLREYVHLPHSAMGIPPSREHYYLQFRKWISAKYAAFTRNRWATYVVNGFFILQCLTQMFDLLYLLLDGSYYRNIDPKTGNVATSEDTGGQHSIPDETDFADHLLVSPVMKFLREISSGKLSDTLLLDETDKVTKLHILQLFAVSRAFIWFRRSMLVRLFITDSLSLYHSQFMAFGDVVFTLAIVMALSFMVAQEESSDRMRRLSASGSLDLVGEP